MDARMRRKHILDSKKKQDDPVTFARRKRLKEKEILKSDITKGVETDASRLIGSHGKAWDFGPPTYTCQHCGAILWYEERTLKTKKPSFPKFSLCCGSGKVDLPLLMEAPPPLSRLLNSNGDATSSRFRNKILIYNSLFSFTSMGGKIDTSINKKNGPYVFRLAGQNCHLIGSFLPLEGCAPQFAQLYIYDTEHEVDNRISAVSPNKDAKVDEKVVEELLTMLDDCNILVKSFRQARDRFKDLAITNFTMHLLASRSGKQYDMPSCNEIAAIVVEDIDENNSGRDIIVEHRSSGLQRINEEHPCFMSLQYPLLFPYGEDGFRLDIPYRTSSFIKNMKRRNVTMREFYAFRLQYRVGEGKTLLLGGRLLQQFIVDAYTCIEEYRLRWIRNNQQQLRVDLYKGLADAVYNGETNAAHFGKRVILPSTFTGGPRYMVQNYQDAMAICRWAGYPDIFMTFTCNPKWPEIDYMLQYMPGLRPEDRSDVVARVFKIKLDHLLHDIKHEKRFGRVKLVVYTIEFQKRGLPHAHIIVFLDLSDKCPTIDQVDSIISAEIPDPEDAPLAYDAVRQFMIHGPCGKDNPSCPCMKKQKCTKHFPKSFCDMTTIDDDGFPRYRRRNTGRTIEKNGIFLDNQYVVPHNLDLLVKYQAHLNVEWCNHSRSIKYLFKYINKGSDKATVLLKSGANTSDSSKVVVDVDETKTYLDCRYISASEACWRIFEFDIHYRYPAVERLYYHLEREHSVTFSANTNLCSVLHRPGVQDTMFTEWMRTNSIYAEARKLSYADFPTNWVWHPNEKKWKKRVTGKCIGRLYHAHPSSGERFYLRMLLNVVRGPTTFREIRTVDGRAYKTYKEACYARGLLENDKEWHDALLEASYWASSRHLRELFVTILMFCEVADPCQLWEQNWKLFSDDIIHTQRRILECETLKLTDSQLKAHILVAIEKILQQFGKSLSNFPQMPLADPNLLSFVCNRLIAEELTHDITTLVQENEILVAGLNDEQRQIHESIVQAIFVGNGIAALLLPGGRTAHSRFHIPLDIHDDSTCAIKHKTHVAELLMETSVILWDEAPMTHRNCFEALDRSLRDIMAIKDNSSMEKPFGGKVVVLGGDFRQILPVVKKGRREDIVHASVNKSYLWKYCRVFRLHTNMRLHQEGTTSSVRESIRTFGNWILNIGDGKDSDDHGQSMIIIPDNMLIKVDTDPIKAIVSNIYPDLNKNLPNAQYLRERAILAPTNEIVEKVNNYMVSLVKGYEVEYRSADSICNSSSGGLDKLYNTEFLNSLSMPGLPNHELKLKIGLPVMLLRNLNQFAGLCNGTRLIITKLGKWIVEAEIITGSNIGDRISIPRITLSPVE